MYLCIYIYITHTYISHLHAKHASNGSCCCWKFLHQFARPDGHWLQYTSSFSVSWTSVQSQMKNLSKKTFVSGCKVRGYLPWKHPSAFQPLQFCSSPSYKQKRFMWPCSKLFWLCSSCKQLLVSSTITAKLMSKFVFVPPPNNRLLSLDCILSKVGVAHNYTWMSSWATALLVFE